MKSLYTSANQYLTILVEETDNALVLKWSGKSTSLYPSEFLNPIFEEALATHKKIIMNFYRLDFVTSSTITPLIKLLEKIKNDGSWQLELQYDSSVDWQNLTFSALGVFTECDRIQIKGL